MNWLGRLLNGLCTPRKEQKPKFHKTIPQIDNPDFKYESYILSGYPKVGWFKLADEPITKNMLILSSDTTAELTGRYVEYGSGFAVELKEERSYIPEEWVGLRVRFV